MVTHDRLGFMTEEFRKYSQEYWDSMRDQVQAIVAQAIRDGVNPIAMKAQLSCAVDCGTTMAKAEAKVASHRPGLWEVE